MRRKSGYIFLNVKVPGKNEHRKCILTRSKVLKLQQKIRPSS